MQNNALRTLLLIAKDNSKKLSFTFLLVLLENALFLPYPILAGIAINAITAGNTKTALIYSAIVAIGWGLGALRRRVDTQVFTRIYTDMVVKVIMNERRLGAQNSTIIARANLSREFVDFFEQQLPMIFMSVVSLLGSAIMLVFIQPIVGIVCLITLSLLGIFLPRYVRANDNLYLRLNNRIEHEAKLIKHCDERNLSRHYTLISKLKTAISNREAASFLIIGLIAASIFTIAIVLLSSQNPSAGHIYSVLTYLWTYAISLDDAPSLIEKYSNLKDIGKRVSIELDRDI